MERLEELRLAALEDRVQAELALGRHSGLVAELEALVAEHPLRERPRGQLMLALYRAGRQAEALEVYRATRQLLVEHFRARPIRAAAGTRAGDPHATTPRSSSEPRRRSRATAVVLVAPSRDDRIGALVEIATLMRAELVVARLVAGEDELAAAAAAVGATGRKRGRRRSRATPRPPT